MPPVRCTFGCCFFAGELDLVLGAEAGFGLGSDIRRPAAEGGSLFAGGVCVRFGGPPRRARVCAVC